MDEAGDYDYGQVYTQRLRQAKVAIPSVAPGLGRSLGDQT